MELRHLRYFVAVAEELHFRRAAERLHVAQPAVSEQVRKLEEELGVSLFERAHKTVSLTAAGAAMLEESKRVLRLAEGAQHAARNAHESVTDRLRVGYASTALSAAVPRALQAARTSVGELDATLEPGAPFELVEAVATERLDAAIVPLPVPASGLRITPLGEQHAVAALPSDHPEATQLAIALDRLAPERLTVVPREANRPFHDAVIAACHAAGLAPTLVVVPDIPQALLTVAAGTGIALLPESVVAHHAAPGVRFVPLEQPAPGFTSGVVTRRDGEHGPTAAFLQALSRGAGAAPPAPAPREHVAIAV